METLPAAPGVYALALRLARPADLTIARQRVHLPPGLLVYVGSAHGPGGLRARLGRHLRGDGRPRWHIDTLRAVAEVVGWHVAVSPQRLECAWAQALAHLPGAAIPVPGFGASDCRAGCPAHLILLPSGVDLEAVWTALDRVETRHVASLHPLTPSLQPTGADCHGCTVEYGSESSHGG